MRHASVCACFEHLLLGVAMGKRAGCRLKTCVCPAVSTSNRKQPFIAGLDASSVEGLRKKSLVDRGVYEDKVLLCDRLARRASFSLQLQLKVSLNSSYSCVGSRLPVLPREQGAEEHHQVPAGKVVQRAGALLRPLYLYHATGAGQNPR